MGVGKGASWSQLFARQLVPCVDARWPVVFFEGFLFTCHHNHQMNNHLSSHHQISSYCRCCCRCLGEGFVCVSDRVMRRVMRHMKKVDGNAPLPLEPTPPTLLTPKLPLSLSPSLLLFLNENETKLFLNLSKASASWTSMPLKSKSSKLFLNLSKASASSTSITTREKNKCQIPIT